MKVAFIHQSLPGQFGHLAKRLAQDPSNEVVFLTKPRRQQIPGVRKVVYRPAAAPYRGTHGYIIGLQNGIHLGRAVAKALLEVRNVLGFRPDIVYAHPGWGEALFVKDIYPDVPLLNYFEFYYRGFGADTYFDVNEEPSMDELFRIRTKNGINLLSLESCDWGISPTLWQWRQQPPEFRSKISVIHDGVDTAALKPDREARITLPGGLSLAAGDEVVTYVNRSLEPYRGLPSFLRAAAAVCAKRPACHVLIVGSEGRVYGRRPPPGMTYRDMVLKEVEIDPARVHFLGALPYREYLKVLQVSAVHVYLTVPFVLSWSMIEAMSVGCLVVGSNTPPVAEVIEDGKNGLLADFYSPEEIAERIEEGLGDRARMEALRERARQTAVERYDLERCLPLQIKLIEDLVAGRRPRDGAEGAKDRLGSRRRAEGMPA